MLKQGAIGISTRTLCFPRKGRQRVRALNCTRPPELRCYHSTTVRNSCNRVITRRRDERIAASVEL